MPVFLCMCVCRLWHSEMFMSQNIYEIQKFARFFWTCSYFKPWASFKPCVMLYKKPMLWCGVVLELSWFKISWVASTHSIFSSWYFLAEQCGFVTWVCIPRPFEEEEKGPDTHCVHMRYFPSKSWEFVFLSAYFSISTNLDLRNMPKNHFLLAAFQAKDACCDQFS